MQPIGATDFRTDVPESVWFARPAPRKRPQATHRALVRQDFVHGIDARGSAPSSPSSARKVSRAPRLETIFEERKLRTKRCELDDPLPGSTLRFSAIYCPQVFGQSIFPGMPRVWQAEHLEHFVVLARWGKHYVNIMPTLTTNKSDGMRRYALGLFREAFANGKLR